jgi:vitamin B12 transporter
MRKNKKRTRRKKMRTNNCVWKKSLLFAVTLLLITGLSVAAEEPAEQKTLEEMVVTGTRTDVPVEETTKSIDVIYARDREEQQQYWLPELIDNQPGVLMRRLGGPGQWSVISIRGAGPQHTQFQFNGMPLRDAADTQSALQYFIEDLYSTSNLDRVEVLKGTNSVLYGSSAMGGVINIIPKKWQKGLSAEFRNEVGPNSTYIGNARLAYGQDRYYIDINPLYVTTDGEKYGGEHGYYYDNKGLTFGAGIRPTDNTSLEFSAIAYDSDLAMGSSPSLDANHNLIKNQADPTQHRESQIYQLGLNWNHQISPFWDYSIKGSQGATERHYFWSNTSGDQSNYDGETSYIEMQHNLHVTDWLTFNLGGDYEKSVYDGEEPNNPGAGDYSRVYYDEEWGTYDAFGQAQFALMDRSLFFTLGGRYNDHEIFDDKTVWEASGAYILKQTNTKFHAHVGTGYRTPSLYEVYGGYVWAGTLFTIGNPNLKPETSKGYEFGIDQSFFNGKAKVGATYFYTKFKDLIGFDNTLFQYYNLNEAKTSGVEAYISLKPWPLLKLDLAYTYADAKGKATSASEWARSNYQPRNKLDFVATVYPMENLTITCDVSWQDEKIVPLNDPGWNRILWEEDAVTTVDLAAAYKVWKHIDLFMRVENLFDKDYTESAYCMPGRSLYGGVKLYF